MALHFPDAEVIGIDLALPTERFHIANIASNCNFYRANLEQDWSFPGSHSSFDFISARMLIAAIQDWPQLLRRCYNHLSPGGYLEIFEGTFEMRTGNNDISEPSSAVQWFDLVKQYMSDVGMQWDAALGLPEQIQDAGFDLVADKVRKMTLYPDEADPEETRDWIAK